MLELPQRIHAFMLLFALPMDGSKPPQNASYTSFPILPYLIKAFEFLLAVLIIAFVALFIWIWRKQPTFRKSFKTLAELLKIVGELLNKVVGVLKIILETLQYILCFLRIYTWLLMFFLRRLNLYIVFFVFIVGGFWTVFELTARLFAQANWLSWVQEVSTTIAEWKGFTNPYILAVLLLIETMIIVNHWRELQKLGRQKATLNQINGMLGPLKLVLLESDSRKKNELANRFLNFFASTVIGLFETKEVRGLHVALMEPDPNDGNKLRVVFASDPGQINMEYKLDPDCGGAGKALATKCLFYFPNVNFRHGIQVGNKLDVLPDVYKSGGGINGQDFKSILCVPIKDSNGSGVAVLNLSTLRTDAFSHSDFDLALLIGRVLEFLY